MTNLNRYALVKNSALLLSSFVLTAAMLAPVRAETVLERVTRTGVMNAGTRVDALPFAYIDKDGVWKGYSIDMMELIKTRLEQETGRKIQMKLARVTVGDRVNRIGKGEIDIVCGATSLNLRNIFEIDFSVGYFVTGTQLLKKKNQPPVSTGRWVIGVIPNTTNQLFIRERFPIATPVAIRNRSEGVAALQSGRIDAFASDGILLAGLMQAQPNREEFELVPAKPLTFEEYACILPKEDTQFRTLVNDTLVGFMQGVLNDREQEVAIFDKWFGPKGIAPINRQPILDYFQQVVSNRQQEPPVRE
ncbi:amino acid ABC transporter substrate-binding protein [Kovacikia minuta CCNUW1]|uniref:amino acid ABC transporter substrate-binding protein n=1 Tax=Kovacikia minuta TaxID=2931930 RepID=UPI001CC95025|nr:amino acid ABC transporter substrate-binding protein [Kovacikia minuta]UBF24084.1 amino acid ABC transporter substrate-binding protein [Kovacikia minuta CCNUW1]